MNRIALLIVVLIGIAYMVDGHSYVTSPTSRSNQKQSNTGCRGPACLGPCDASASRARTPIVIQRGASVNVQWPRNNHAGGFIRFAWAPTSQSDTMSVFDNNVQEIVCHERGGCKPDSASDPNGGDSGPSDGSVNPCQATITIPPHLTDGLWTLQWAWFGGAFSLGDYYSCVDYQISGGNSGSKPAPFFQGGDYTYPGQQKCKFFNTDRIHQCVNEPCNNPVYPAAQEKSGPAFGISSSSGSSSTTTTTGPKQTTTTTTTTTTGKQTTGTTTGKQTTTTGVQSSTTTTGVKQTTTTSGSHSTSTGSSETLCYQPGTPNLNGKMTGTCGRKAPRARCPDGQCCSQWGYCGPIARGDGTYYEYVDGAEKYVSAEFATQLYCNKTQGDYRKVPCNTIQGGVQANLVQDKTGGSSTLIYDRFVLVFGIALAFLIARLF